MFSNKNHLWTPFLTKCSECNLFDASAVEVSISIGLSNLFNFILMANNPIILGGLHGFSVNVWAHPSCMQGGGVWNNDDNAGAVHGLPVNGGA